MLEGISRPLAMYDMPSHNYYSTTYGIMYYFLIMLDTASYIQRRIEGGVPKKAFFLKMGIMCAFFFITKRLMNLEINDKV